MNAQVNFAGVKNFAKAGASMGGGLLKILRLALAELSPRAAFKSPIRAIVYLATVGAILWALGACVGLVKTPPLMALSLAFWISLTLIFSAFTDAVASHQAREQTDRLRTARNALKAKKLCKADCEAPIEEIPAALLKTGELIIVRAGETIPADGEVILGTAAVDESALTGESAPVIRSCETQHASVTALTRVLSDWIIVKVRSAAGESFVDKMLLMVERTRRQQTPVEASIETYLLAQTVLYLFLTIAIGSFSAVWAQFGNVENPFGTLELIALFLCMAPTTIGVLLPIVSLAGMLRLMKANIVAKSSHVVEAAGNVDVVLLDKTGTITLGDRQACRFFPCGNLAEKEFAREAQLASLSDNTPEGRSIVILAKKRFGLRQNETAKLQFVPFSAQTQMSGVDLENRRLRKGSVAAIGRWLQKIGREIPPELQRRASRISSEGGTALVLADDHSGARGVIELRDVIKGGLAERFEKLRELGIETIMITGDNPLTAASVAAEAGVDRFIAEATPEEKLRLIREFQKQGHTVAMTGDGTNDAPALAQADVALAMNSGTQPSKEACNLIDLDSNPTKLIEVVQIGKQNLITIGATLTFSMANDIAKFLTLLPSMASGIFPQLARFDLLKFASPAQALQVALIFNALIIPLLLPLALSGSPKPQNTRGLLLKHILLYGLGGAAIPFILMRGILVLL